MHPDLQSVLQSLSRGRLHYLPVVPGAIEFGPLVQEAITAVRPNVVAVELPAPLEDAYMRGAARLPEISAIVSERPELEETFYVVIEPADPFVESVRTASALGIEVAFLDPGLNTRPHVEDLYPDTHAVSRIGYAEYVSAYRFQRHERRQELVVQAEGAAWKLQGLDPEARVLVVTSLNILDPLLDAMEQPQAQPLRLTKLSNTRLINIHPESLAEVCQAIPFFQAVREIKRGGEDVPAPAAPEQRTTRGFEVVTTPQQDPRERELYAAAGQPFDLHRLHWSLFQATQPVYERKTGESVAHWQRRLWARYARNLAIVQSRLLSGIFDLTVAARGVVDDNFAWELWESANYYPAQNVESDLATVKLSGEHLWDHTRKMRIRPLRPPRKGKARPIGLKGRKKPKHPGEWEMSKSGYSICSYPPEDLVIENYGNFLKKKGKGLLSDERMHVEPFSTSLLDGIDLRETLRNWHDGKIYVQSRQRIQGEVGAVVLVFDQGDDERYPYQLTWLGEHQNESDMAFYATRPEDNVIGPGIGRVEYGGLLLTLPSRRLGDVWSDPTYFAAESKAEVLLFAALDYSVDRLIVYVADKPPRSMFRSIAGRIGRKIVYVPKGQLSPVALKKIRVMHVLDSHERRESAKDYIW